MADIPDILKKIVLQKKKEVKILYHDIGINRMIDDIKLLPNKHISFIDALRTKNLSVIAEIKKASPSVGIISENFNHLDVAKTYDIAKVDAISVLTDELFFMGSLDFIADVKKIVSCPVLRKDFIIDKIQIFQSKLANADAFLLIAAILSLDEIVEFIELGKTLGLDALVEVHNEKELEKVIRAKCEIIGINNRDLKTFNVDLNTTTTLAKKIPKTSIIVAESGIKDINSVRLLKYAKCDAILVGETLMRKNKKDCIDEILKYKSCKG